MILMTRITALVLMLLAHQAYSLDTLISPTDFSNTENGVFTDDGRHFMAVADKFVEIRAAGNGYAGCQPSADGQFELCTLKTGSIAGNSCTFGGMTTDGTTIYTACGILNNYGFSKSDFYRVTPTASGASFDQVSIATNNVYANGMAVLSANEVLISNTSANGLNFNAASIIKLTITSTAPLAVTESLWLHATVFDDFPNGIQVDGQSVYYAGGTKLYKIAVNADGSAGYKSRIYTAPWGGLLDDFAVLPDSIAVAEIAKYYPLMGANSIVFVDKLDHSVEKLPTGDLQASSLIINEGGLFGDYALIVTSWFQGGVYGI